MEEWRDIKGYEGLYQVSSLGRVRSLDRISFHLNRWGTLTKTRIRGRIRRTNISNSGYSYLPLSKNGNDYCAKIHRLVAEAFIPNPYNYPEVNHKDGNKQNNIVSNLEWCTHSMNHIHAVATGLADLEKIRRKHYRKVRQIDPNTGKEVKIWPSIKEAGESLSRSKYPDNPIWKCLHGLRAYNTAYGYRWEYVK